MQLRIGSCFPIALLLWAPAAWALLTQVQVLTNTPDPSGLGQAVAASPDGSHVYGASSTEIDVFARNPATGRLALASSVAVNSVPEFLPTGQAALSLSPDGAHLYMARPGSFFVNPGLTDSGEIVVFERNPVTGALNQVAIKRTNASNSFANVRDLAVSPDGAHVYAVSMQPDNALVVFERDAATGGLTEVETERDGVAGVDGLAGAYSVAVSPDGASVYVAGIQDDAVAVFDRDPTTGALTFLEVHRDGVAGVDGLDGATAVAVSGDGTSVYATATVDDAIAVFDRDPATGALSFVEVHQDGVAGVSGMQSPNDIAVAPDDSRVLVTSGGNSDAVVLFARDPATGALEFVRSVPSGTKALGAVGGLSNPTALVTSPGGEHVYVAAVNDQALTVFAFDELTNDLGFVETHGDDSGVDGLIAVRSAALSPDGAHLYAGGFEDEIAIFRRNALTGTLCFAGVVDDGEQGVWGLTDILDIALSPDGSSLYVTGRNLTGGDSITVFARDPLTGYLDYVEVEGSGPNGSFGRPTVIAVSPDDAHVYVADSEDDAILIFARILATGALDLVGMVQGGVGGALAVSPDGRNVYSGGPDLTVFDRDASSGALSFVELHQAPEVPGVTTSVASSADGKNVYVGGTTGIVVFARDAATGRLTAVETLELPTSTATNGVVVSADGSLVYATSSSTATDALVVFFRDAESGALSLAESHVDGVGGVAGLDGPTRPAPSADGRHVYVAALDSGALSTFRLPGAVGAVGPRPLPLLSPWAALLLLATLPGVAAFAARARSGSRAPRPRGSGGGR